MVFHQIVLLLNFALMCSQVILLAAVLWALWDGRRKASPHDGSLPSLTVLIPCHNEEGIVRDCVRAALAAGYNGVKRVIVVDDASTDRTPEVLASLTAAAPASSRSLQILRNGTQMGKARSLNLALEAADTELVAVVDGDSVVEASALGAMAGIFAADTAGEVAGCGGVIHVRNRARHPLLWWVHLDQLYFSLIRHALTAMGANLTAPGPLSMYRREVLRNIGGFNPRIFVEDLDVGVRLIRGGYRMAFCREAVSETVMPHDARAIFQQRLRWTRGNLFLLKEQMRLSPLLIDLYTLPVMLVAYFQGVVMGPVSWSQMGGGYLRWYVRYGNGLSLGAVKYFFEWATQWGFVLYLGRSLFSGEAWSPPTFCILVTGTIGLVLFCTAIARYERALDARTLCALFFLQPFWWFSSLIAIAALPTLWATRQENLWAKRSTLPYRL